MIDKFVTLCKLGMTNKSYSAAALGARRESIGRRRLTGDGDDLQELHRGEDGHEVRGGSSGGVLALLRGVGAVDADLLHPVAGRRPAEGRRGARQEARLHQRPRQLPQHLARPGPGGGGRGGDGARYEGGSLGHPAGERGRNARPPRPASPHPAPPLRPGSGGGEFNWEINNRCYKKLH